MRSTKEELNHAAATTTSNFIFELSHACTTRGIYMASDPKVEQHIDQTHTSPACIYEVNNNQSPRASSRTCQQSGRFHISAIRMEGRS